MSFPGHDDTSSGRTTQGGSSDHLAPGPARRSGRSIWWVLAAGVLLLALIVGVMAKPRHRAPAEANTTAVSGTLTGDGASPAAAAPGPPAGPAR